MVSRGIGTTDLVLEKLRALESRKRNLLQLRRDLARQEYLGLEPIYALDFSEVMAYIAPIPAMSQPESVWHEYGERFSFRSPDTSLILDLLAAIRTAFFLPVGSIHELREFLRHFFPKVVARSPLDDSIDNFRGIASLQQQLERLDMESDDIAAALSTSKAREEFERLHSLFLRVCTPGKEIREVVGQFGLDERTFHRAVRELTSVRPEHPSQNRVDAINYSMVADLSSRWTEHRQIFFLVTRKRPLRALQEIQWDDDPLDDFPAVALSETPASRSLVRDVAYLGYAALAASAKPRLDQRIEFVDELLGSIKEEATRMVSSARHVRFREERPGKRRDQEDLAVMFEQLATQFAGADLSFGVASGRAEPELSQEMVETRYHEIEERLREDIASFSSLAQKAADSGDLLRGLVRPPLAQVAFLPADSPSGRAWSISAAGEPIPLGTVHERDDHFEVSAVAEPGGFDWFIQLASDLYAFMSERDSIQAMRMAHKLMPPGLLLASRSSALFVPINELTHPLTPEDAWSLAFSNGIIPAQIRFCSQYFDLHYRLVTAGQLAGRCTLITHLAVPEVVATYFARAIRRLVTVQEILPQFEKFLTTDLAEFSPYLIAPALADV